MEIYPGPIKVGDRVVVQGYPFPVRVARIYWIDRDGEETEFRKLAAKVMLELDWGELGRSKVALDDENRIWYRYQNKN